MTTRNTIFAVAILLFVTLQQVEAGDLAREGRRVSITNADLDANATPERREESKRAEALVSLLVSGADVIRYVGRFSAVGPNPSSLMQAEGIDERPSRFRLVGMNTDCDVQITPDKGSHAGVFYRGRENVVDAAAPQTIRYVGVYPGIDLKVHLQPGLSTWTFVIDNDANPASIRLAFDGYFPVINKSTGEVMVGNDNSAGASWSAPMCSSSTMPLPCRFVPAGSGSIGIEVDRTRAIVGERLRTIELTCRSFPHKDALTWFSAVASGSPLSILTAADGAIFVAGESVLHDAAAGDRSEAMYSLVYKSDERTSPTFFGGSDREYSIRTFRDPNGNVYVAGTTRSNDFPLVGSAVPIGPRGDADVFVAVFSSDGKLKTSTVLGGSGDDELSAIVVTPDGAQIFLAGSTTSSDFPGAAPGRKKLEKDAFVAVVKSTLDGLAVPSVVFGGTADDIADSLVMDRARNVYVAGRSWSADFPTSPSGIASPGGGTVAPFVTRLALDGRTRAYKVSMSTVLARRGGFSMDETSSGRVFIGLDRFSQLLVIGKSAGNTLTTPGAFQGMLNGPSDLFAIRLADDGSRVTFGTYFGGSGNETATDVRFDADGAAYIVGLTDSKDFPRTDGISTYGSNAEAYLFLTQIDLANGKLAVSRHIAVSRADALTHGTFSLDLDGARNAFIACSMPVLPPAAPPLPRTSFWTDSSAAIIVVPRCDACSAPPVITGARTSRRMLLIDGENFSDGATVFVNGKAIPAHVQGGFISATLPAEPDGDVEVQVINSNNVSSSAWAVRESMSKAPQVNRQSVPLDHRQPASSEVAKTRSFDRVLIGSGFATAALLLFAFVWSARNRIGPIDTLRQIGPGAGPVIVGVGALAILGFATYGWRTVEISRTDRRLETLFASYEAIRSSIANSSAREYELQKKSVTPVAAAPIATVAAQAHSVLVVSSSKYTLVERGAEECRYSWEARIVNDGTATVNVVARADFLNAAGFLLYRAEAPLMHPLGEGTALPVSGTFQISREASDRISKLAVTARDE